MKAAFTKYYIDALDYLDKWFNFLDDFSFMERISLDSGTLCYQVVSNTFKKFVSTEPEELDTLFEEVGEINDNLEQLGEQINFKNLEISAKWVVLLKNKNVVVIKPLISALLSIFPSNAYCESVFSIVDNVWSDEKSRLSIDTLNVLVCVKCNSDVSCSDIYATFLDNKTLFKQAKTVEKYQFNQ